MTRLAAFYYSDIPGEVGPVRSMRASDIGIVSPVGGSMVTSGAANVTLQRIGDAGIDYYSEGRPGSSGRSDRSAPYNLFTDLGEVAKAAEHTKTRPDDYLPWGSEDDLPQGQPATSASRRRSPAGTPPAGCSGTAATSTRTPTPPTATSSPPTPCSCCGSRSATRATRDPAGNPVPETQFEGTGDAMVFHDGRLVRGTWSKKALDSALTLSTKAGDLRCRPAGCGSSWCRRTPAT